MFDCTAFFDLPGFKGIFQPLYCMLQVDDIRSVDFVQTVQVPSQFGHSPIYDRELLLEVPQILKEFQHI